MKKFDRANAEDVNRKLNALLKQFAADNGLVFNPGRAKFSSYNFSKKFEFDIVGADATDDKQTDEYMKFRLYAKKYGYNPAFFNTVVRVGSAEYRVTGVNPRSYRRPVKLVDIKTGQNYKANAQFLANAVIVDKAAA